jgi:lipopolysaccharide/colanic/teichoic acid biosynthesis glycosyltransferase
MQRFFDVVFSGLALLVLAPILIPVMILLLLTGEGEVFYRQMRVGRGGELFGLLKFATMMKNSPNMGTGTLTLANDPRVLPVGRVLRALKINELPQLINILKGDMSVIGPRPQTQRCFNAFLEESKDALRSVRPGLSGIGSIVFRAETQMLDKAENAEWFYDHVIMPYKGRLEEWYVQNQSLRNYFLLIFLTPWVVVLPSSRLVWKVFPRLPQPPQELRGRLMSD